MIEERARSGEANFVGKLAVSGYGRHDLFDLSPRYGRVLAQHGEKSLRRQPKPSRPECGWGDGSRLNSTNYLGSADPRTEGNGDFSAENQPRFPPSSMRNPAQGSKPL